MIKLSKNRAISKYVELFNQIDNLQNQNNAAFVKWEADVKTALRYTFGELSQQAIDFKGISFSPLIITDDTTERDFADWRNIGLSDAKPLISAWIDEIQDYWEENPTQHTEIKSMTKMSNEIFIVHGHDNGVKQEVARFVTDIGLKPIILHEQSNQGRTIIEKFEDHSDVEYAIVLYTPDDIGRAKIDNEEKERPRQNVVFELGYFIAKLGRNKVCCLRKGKAEVLSDISGVVYTTYDESGAWKMKIVQELKDIGLPIDANALFPSSTQ